MQSPPPDSALPPQHARLDLSEPAAPAGADARAFESLHPRARGLMRFGAIVGFVLPPAIPSAILLSAWDGGALPPTLRVALWFALCVALAFAGWRYGGARYARTRFALDGHGLHIRRGVIWQSETFVARDRVQHTDVNRGPLDRRFGLSSLKVYTAGTKLASIELDGLPEQRALELRDALSNTDEHDL
jgi:membrane protein YdbS with pleckstrin-like domain